MIFNVEPDAFENFFEALYWSVVSLTTIGYGDITILSTWGRIITIVSTFVGIAIVALPASMMTAGFMDELSRRREEEKREEEN